jgi:hypothetical protein
VDLTTEFFDGSIREFRIWNTARSAGQINDLMDDTLTVAWYGSPDSGVAAYYRCDRLEDLSIGGDGANDVRDLSVNGYHGDSFGSPQIVAGCAVTDIGYSPHHQPEKFSLLQNYPNPFNAMTVIRYNLPEALNVDISIYDLLGRRISQFSRGKQPAGIHNFRYDAGSLPGGIYFYHIRVGQLSDTGKMILIK